MPKDIEYSVKKKPYKAPRLLRYGDFRTLTRGSTKKKSEASGIAGPKTRAQGAA